MGMPDSNGVFDIHEQMDSDLIKLVSNVNSYERENVVRLENSVELLLENLQSCLSKIGLSQGAIESYETGSFITGKDAGTLNTGIKIFGDLHEKNKEAYDEIYETEQKIKDEAEKRRTQGIWRTVGGAVLIATGAACIVLTGGAAIPIVADVAVAVGSGTAVFGAADAIEGTQDIYYGSTGDIDSTAVNGIKDDLFQGNEDAYYLTENAFAFASSAMIPIGTASKAGELTFRSGTVMLGKEGVSTLAGYGASNLVYDKTNNQTLGMIAGILASTGSAKGLNMADAKLGWSNKGVKGNVVESVTGDIESGKAIGTDELVVRDTKFLDADGNIDWEKWAPNGGRVPGTIKENQTIPAGTIIDRYGSQWGKYTSPAGVPYEQRALPYIENPNAYHKYEVLKPIDNVTISEIAPAFEQVGGGIQYELPNNIKKLKELDYIKEIK